MDAPTRPATRAVSTSGPRELDHRNGAGHLDPTYETALRASVGDRAHNAAERTFVRGVSTDDSAEERGREFLMTVTSGQDGGELALDEETSEERAARTAFGDRVDTGSGDSGTAERDGLLSRRPGPDP